MPNALRRLVPAIVLAAALLGAAHAQSRVTVLSPQEPATLLPHFDLLTLTHEIQQLAFDCLFVAGANGEYRPHLAAEVPTVANGGISEDGTTYTIRLRDDATWHDGEPVTAGDLRYTWQVITDQELPIPSRAVWEDIASIETPDPTTAVVRFEETNVAFLGAASSDACFLLPEHALAGTDLVNSPQNRDPIGSGAYEVAEWRSGAYVRLTARDDYFLGAPEVDEIVVRFPGGSQAVRTALQRGEAELALHIGSADLRFAQNLDGFTVQQAPDHAWWQFWINNQDPILEDVAVRRALAHGLDKALITETVFAGVVEPQHAMLPPSHWAHADDVRTYGYDPEAARSLLEEAGWTHEDGDGVREKDGQRSRSRSSTSPVRPAGARSSRSPRTFGATSASTSASARSTAPASRRRWPTATSSWPTAGSERPRSRSSRCGWARTGRTSPLTRRSTCCAASRARSSARPAPRRSASSSASSPSAPRCCRSRRDRC